VKVLVTPRDPNPYQELLHAELRRLGVTITYLDGPTGSQTLNLLLRPLQLVVFRLFGYRVLHVHWVYDWVPFWAASRPWGRRLAQAWLEMFLLTAAVLGYRRVWTAHNILPHERTFSDDVAARRRLISLVDDVIVHSEATVPAVTALSAVQPHVIEQGSYFGHYPPKLDRDAARARLGLHGTDRVAVHIGALRPYKGADRLLGAMATRRPSLTLVIAGLCTDPIYRHRLETLAADCGERVVLSCRYLPDEDLVAYLSAADVAVFAFRTVTNSSAVQLCLDAGVPVLVPDLAAFAGLPEDSVLRFDSSDEGLEAAIVHLASLPAAELDALGEAARGHVSARSWRVAASQTLAVYRGELGDGEPGVYSSPAARVHR
jgi:beta-1,4-mannosyltransferase